jgi:hypothetical protein
LARMADGRSGVPRVANTRHAVEVGKGACVEAQPESRGLVERR